MAWSGRGHWLPRPSDRPRARRRRGSAGGGDSYGRPRPLIEEVDVGTFQIDAVEQVDDLVAVHLLALDQRVGHALDLVAVGRHRDVGGDVGLTEKRGDRLALVAVGQGAGDRVLLIGPAATSTAHDLYA